MKQSEPHALGVEFRGKENVSVLPSSVIVKLTIGTAAALPATNTTTSAAAPASKYRLIFNIRASSISDPAPPSIGPRIWNFCPCNVVYIQIDRPKVELGQFIQQIRTQRLKYGQHP
jgi:hypothetical protein